MPLHRRVLLILLTVFGGVVGWQLLGRTVDSGPRTARADLTSEEVSNIQIFQNNAPSVVFITSTAVRYDRYTMRPLEMPQGTGSGFIWDTSGHVVTNYHVIEQALKERNIRVEITLYDQTTLPASLVGIAPHKDLAVLKVDLPDGVGRHIPTGRSDNLIVGQKVFAIGNPFGFDHTLTTGVISGLNREIQSVTNRPIQGVVQTDAAINPGNSGGPLLDSKGELIGVNTAIFSPSGAYAGIGFAVPVDTVKRIVPQLIEYGKVIRPGLGVVVDEREGLGPGARILRIARDSAADKAGLRGVRRDARGRLRFDTIIGVDNVEISTPQDLYRILDDREVGDSVILRVQRGPEQASVKVILQALD
ncbi:MAG: trypsin-like peptidase domain-containing protein [Myxococcota bacterium]|nr:trypsin-like peptidase domain-containing protein [Myxococcota bacterium]